MENMLADIKNRKLMKFTNFKKLTQGGIFYEYDVTVGFDLSDHFRSCSGASKASKLDDIYLYGPGGTAGKGHGSKRYLRSAE